MADKILQDGNARAMAILEDAEMQIREIEKQAQKISEERIQHLKLKLQNDSNQLRMTIESNSELEKRNSLLKCKQEKIDQVFEMACASIREMEPSIYIQVLVNKLLKSAATGTEDVIFSSHDKELVGKQIVSEANQELGRLGRINQLILSELTADIKGGFILKAENYEMNHSIESLVNQARETLEPSIVKVLFD